MVLLSATLIVYESLLTIYLRNCVTLEGTFLNLEILNSSLFSRDYLFSFTEEGLRL
jgi:hypothetical protein